MGFLFGPWKANSAPLAVLELRRRFPFEAFLAFHVVRGFHAKRDCRLMGPPT